MIFIIGVPLAILLATGFGFLMTKKMESILLGKIWGAFGFLFFMFLLVLFAFLVQN